MLFRKSGKRAEWSKLNMKEQARGKGKPAEQAQKVQAKLAIHEGGREDDFQDDTHISA